MNVLNDIPTIESPSGRFILRPFVNATHDVDTLVRNINSSHVSERVSNVPHPYTVGHALAWLELMHKNRMSIVRGELPKRLDFAIDYYGQVVGSVAFINIEGHKAQLSYWLGEEFHGKGIMTEAVKTVVEFGFTTCGFWKIYGYTWPSNRASQRVLERAGFDVDHVARAEWHKEWKGNVAVRDSVVYAMIRVPDDIPWEKETRYELRRVAST